MQGYKDSGIEWIGDIPGKWRINKIKYIANLYGRIGWQGLTSDEYVDEGPYLITGVDFSNGKIDWNNCVHISEYRWEQADKIKIKNGDLLITKDGTVGKVAIVNNLTGKASLNSGVLLINLNSENNKKFLFWVLCSEVFWTWFNYKNSGKSTILHLYQKDFNEFNYCMPSVSEQQQIADFLDKECKGIDRITEKVEKQIEILKKYKTSLITETVTKGLNKNMKMKDSAVEWIGMIPEDWKVSKVKYNASIKSGRFLDSADFVDNGNIDVYGANGKIGSYDKSNINESSILTGRVGTIGTFAVKENIWITDNVLAIKVDKRSLKFMYYYFHVINFDELSSATAQPLITASKINNLYCLLPEIKEQQQIADFLDKRCSEIDLILSKKAKQSDIIKEHKKSLIYEYVTGKKRVGGVENGD